MLSSDPSAKVPVNDAISKQFPDRHFIIVQKEPARGPVARLLGLFLKMTSFVNSLTRL